MRRSIFLKIFLWFWVAVILLVSTFVVLDRITTSEPRKQHLSRIAATTMKVYGQVAADYFENGDFARYEKFRAQIKQSAILDGYLMNMSGEPLFPGDRPPAELRDLALGVSAKNDTLATIENFRVSVAMPIVSKEKYIFAGTIARIPFSRYLAFDGPAALAIRLLSVIAISGLVCYWLSLYITKPIVRLRAAARKLADGELSTRVGPETASRGDELAALAGDFDAMAERVENLMKLQHQLLGDISHELRSPLARIMLALEMAKPVVPPEGAKLMQRIEKETAIINDMISQLLSLSEMESGTTRQPPTQINLEEMTGLVVADADFEAQNSGKRVVLAQSAQSAECMIKGNYSLLYSAIENVVRNAVRYTLPGTSVTVFLRAAETDGKKSAEVEVRDCGEGVPHEELSNIFRPFYRISNSRDRRSGGVGLGLYITERAVLIHEGSVRAENIIGGLSIVIRLPMERTTNAGT